MILITCGFDKMKKTAARTYLRLTFSPVVPSIKIQKKFESKYPPPRAILQSSSSTVIVIMIVCIEKSQSLSFHSKFTYQSHPISFYFISFSSIQLNTIQSVRPTLLLDFSQQSVKSVHSSDYLFDRKRKKESYPNT